MPRHIVFVDEADLALTGTHKIKSDKIKELALERLGA